jgi:hypothetical protein
MNLPDFHMRNNRWTFFLDQIFMEWKKYELDSAEDALEKRIDQEIRPMSARG